MRQVTLIWGGVVFMMLLLMSGCVREAYNISWKGVVVDETTGKPVRHARILASSSYQANIDETGAQKNYTLSDEYGRFRMSFRRGFGITVRTSASGFLSGLDYKVVKKPDISDTIFFHLIRSMPVWWLGKWMRGLFRPPSHLFGRSILLQVPDRMQAV